MNQHLGLWSFSSKTPTSVGESILRAYFDEAINFTAFGFSDFDAWITYQKSRVPEVVELIGELVISNSASTTVAQAENRVRDLANQSGGSATKPQIVRAAGGSGDTVNWFELVPEVASQSVQDVVSTIQNVGEGVIGTVKLTKYLPWILLGAGALFIVTQGVSLKGLAKKAVGL
jgi:hypothetical protein